MTIEIYKAKNARYYWKAIAGNGEIIATCAGGKQRGYARKADALRAWRRLCQLIVDMVEEG